MNALKYIGVALMLIITALTITSNATVAALSVVAAALVLLSDVKRGSRRD